MTSSSPSTTATSTSPHTTTSPPTDNNDDIVAVLFDNTPFYISQGIIWGMNIIIGFGITYVLPTCHYHVDFIGTGSFALSAIIPQYYNKNNHAMSNNNNQKKKNMIRNNNSRIRYSTYAVVLWSIKLGSFLLYRIMNHKHDNRLNDILSDPSKAIGFWFISGLWGSIVILSHSLGMTSSIDDTDDNTLFNTGTIMYTVGLIIETIADYQKWIFKLNHSSNEFCNVGLWSIVQHPNWFGNILLWSGIYLMNVVALIEPEPVNNSTENKTEITMSNSSSRITNIITNISSLISNLTMNNIKSTLWIYRRVGISILSPLFLYVLFNAQAKGLILTETYQSNLLKYGYGTNVEYTNYINQTPLLIPSISSLLFTNKQYTSYFILLLLPLGLHLL